MSEKPKFITQEELISNEIHQRGEPPYFVHSGTGGMPYVVHGVTEINWIGAINTISDLSNFGLNARTEQILVGFPERTGLLTHQQLQEAEKEGRVVFDMQNSEDVALLRKIDRG